MIAHTVAALNQTQISFCMYRMKGAVHIFVCAVTYVQSGPQRTCAAAKAVVSLVFTGVEQCVNRMCNAVRWSCAAARAGWQPHCRLQ